MKKNILLLFAAAAVLYVYPCCAGVNTASNSAPDNTAPKITYIVLDDIKIDSKCKIDIIGKYIFVVADGALLRFDKPTKTDIEKMKKDKSKQQTVDKGNSDAAASENSENQSNTGNYVNDNTQNAAGKQVEPEEPKEESIDENLHIKPIETIEGVAKAFIYKEKYYYIDDSRKIFVFDNDGFHAYNITIPSAIDSPLFEKTEDIAKKEANEIKKWYNEFVKEITKSADTLYAAADDDKKKFPRWLEFKKYANEKSKNNSSKNNTSAGEFTYFDDWNDNIYKKEYDNNNLKKKSKRDSFNDRWGVEPSGEYPAIKFTTPISKVFYSGKNDNIKQRINIYNGLVDVYENYYKGKKISPPIRDIFNSTSEAVALEITEIVKSDKPIFEQEKKNYNAEIVLLDDNFKNVVRDSLESIQFKYEGQDSRYDCVFLPKYNDIPAYIITQNPKPTDAAAEYTNNDTIDLPDLENTKLLIHKPTQRSDT